MPTDPRIEALRERLMPIFNEMVRAKSAYARVTLRASGHFPSPECLGIPDEIKEWRKVAKRWERYYDQNFSGKDNAD